VLNEYAVHEEGIIMEPHPVAVTPPVTLE
jgi:hypothetical protein